MIKTLQKSQSSNTIQKEKFTPKMKQEELVQKRKQMRLQMLSRTNSVKIGLTNNLELHPSMTKEQVKMKNLIMRNMSTKQLETKNDRMLIKE